MIEGAQHRQTPSQRMSTLHPYQRAEFVLTVSIFNICKKEIYVSFILRRARMVYGAIINPMSYEMKTVVNYARCYCYSYPINWWWWWWVTPPHLISACSEFPLTLYLAVQIAFTAHRHCFIALWGRQRRALLYATASGFVSVNWPNYTLIIHNNVIDKQTTKN